MHQANGFYEIAVVAYDRRRFVMSRPRIVQEMHREIDIRPLFFRLPNVNAIIRRTINGLSPDSVAREMPSYDFQLRNVRVQSLEVYLLSTPYATVVGDSANVCGEILDANYVVFTAQYALTHSPGIEPTIRSALQCTIVKVESIDIDCRTLWNVRLLQKKQRAAKSPW